MKHAVSIPPFAPVETLISMAVDAEEAGWDGVFYWDHLVWLPHLRLDVFDPWALLSAVAARTDRVLLGTLVTPLPRRRPWVVAKQLTTLDHLSNGRAVLGVGLGEPPDAEFAAFGEPAGAKHRAALLDEGLELLDGLLRGPVDHDGEHFRTQTELLPLPVQQPRPPIWVAGFSPNRRPLRRATRWDGVVPLGPDGVLTPPELAGYLALADCPPNWDVVVARAPEIPAGEYADAGTTWLVEGTWPDDDWADKLHAAIHDGPSH